MRTETFCFACYSRSHFNPSYESWGCRREHLQVKYCIWIWQFYGLFWTTLILESQSSTTTSLSKGYTFVARDEKTRNIWNNSKDSSEMNELSEVMKWGLLIWHWIQDMIERITRGWNVDKRFKWRKDWRERESKRILSVCEVRQVCRRVPFSPHDSFLWFPSRHFPSSRIINSIPVVIKRSRISIHLASQPHQHSLQLWFVTRDRRRCRKNSKQVARTTVATQVIVVQGKPRGWSQGIIYSRLSSEDCEQQGMIPRA